jgi:hypothetical protein
MRWTAMFADTPKSESASSSAISRAFGFPTKVARPVRVELTTYSFGGCRSIHLSYGRTVAFHREALESQSRDNCDVFDYSSACTACAPECSWRRGWTADLVLATVRFQLEESFRVQPFARALMS